MAIEDGPFKLSLSKLKETQPTEVKPLPVPEAKIPIRVFNMLQRYKVNAN
jgi:hypothetical protein